MSVPSLTRTTVPVVEEWPPDLQHPPRVDGKLVLRWFVGEWWVLLWGNSASVDGPFILVDHPGPTARSQLVGATQYVDGAADGHWGALPYAAIWAKVAGMKPPRREGTRKRWEDLAPNTRRGYAGRIRSAYGVGTRGWTGRRYRTEAQRVEGEAAIKQFYESAEDLRVLRRHYRPEQTELRVNPGQVRRARAHGGIGAIVSTWHQPR